MLHYSTIWKVPFGKWRPWPRSYTKRYLRETLNLSNNSLNPSLGSFKNSIHLLTFKFLYWSQESDSNEGIRWVPNLFGIQQSLGMPKNYLAWSAPRVTLRERLNSSKCLLLTTSKPLRFVCGLLQKLRLTFMKPTDRVSLETGRSLGKSVDRYL